MLRSGLDPMSDALPDSINLARDLLRCPSVTPTEGGALALIEATLRPAGFTVERPVFEEPGTAPVENLYARIGTGRPNLVFAGHTDVVPPGDETKWSHPPFAGEIVGGTLYGRGAVDMKGAVACAMAASLDYLAARGGKLDGSISFLITGDEESIAVNGTVKLLQWAAERGERFDHCILGEPSNAAAIGDTIKIGRRGSLNGVLIDHRQAGPRRLSAARRQSGPRARQADGRADGALARQRQRGVRSFQSRVHVDRYRQRDGQSHPRRGTRAVQHPLQRQPHAGVTSHAG